MSAPRSTTNVVNLFPPASPAYLERLLKVLRRFEAMDAARRARAVAEFNQAIEAETNPVMKIAFTQMRDFVAKLPDVS